MLLFQRRLSRIPVQPPRRSLPKKHSAQFGVGIPLEAVNGLVRCVHPGAADHVSFGTVLDVGFDGGLNQSYMDVEDLEGRVLDAIKEIGCDLTILCNYGNVAPPTEPVTSGHWDEVTYDSQTDTTTFKDNSGTFPALAIDWWVQPDAGRSTYLDIVNISASEIVVAGNATGLAHGLIQQPLPDPDIIGTFYTIVWPVGVDPATGTLAHDDPCNPASRLLFAGYYYMPPVAGTTVPPSGGSPGVYGKQPGGNLRGDYFCWNRIYDINTGRWTSKDPRTQTPNGLDYALGSPLSQTDATGMKLKISDKMRAKEGFSDYITAQLMRICPAGAWSIDDDGYVSAGDPLFCEGGWRSLGLLLCDDGALRNWVVWQDDADWEGIADADQRTACGLICKIIASEYEVVIDKEGRGLWTSGSKDANYKGAPWEYGDESEEDELLRGTGSGGSMRVPHGPSGTTFFGGTKANPVAFKPSGARTLGHELGHALRAIEGRSKYTGLTKPGRWGSNAVDESENIKEWENPIGRAIRQNDVAAGRDEDWFKNNGDDPYGRGGFESGTDRKTVGVYIKGAPGMAANPQPSKGAIFWD